MGPDPAGVLDWMRALPDPVAVAYETDARDVMHLALLLRLDEYTPARVPTLEQ